MTDLEVVRIPALDDNYIWLMHDPAAGETVVVDPGEAAPVMAAAAERGWTIGQVWVTHWHPDHTAGIAEVKGATGATVSGPRAEAAKIPTLDVLLAEGDTVRIGAHEARVWETPGHTAGHITLVMDDDALAFTGDTLFAMGCGRLFEGTAADMFANMQRLATLPGDTVIYCAHEYTLSNGRFAAHVEPDNEAVRARLAEVEEQRARGEATVPTTIAKELATNPFRRARTVEEFAERRTGKDNF
jgi:hydroxyacylglutathione hydrolase